MYYSISSKFLIVVAAALVAKIIWTLWWAPPKGVISIFPSLEMISELLLYKDHKSVQDHNNYNMLTASSADLQSNSMPKKLGNVVS